MSWQRSLNRNHPKFLIRFGSSCDLLPLWTNQKDVFILCIYWQSKEKLKFLLCDWSLTSQEPFDSSFFGNTISRKSSVYQNFSRIQISSWKSRWLQLLIKVAYPQRIFHFGWNLQSIMPNHNPEHYPPKGPFNNYVDKIKGEGVKKCLFLSKLRVKKNCPRSVGEGSKNGKIMST